MNRLLSFLIACLMLSPAWACTSFIISGKATPSGRPMMFKHRDTDELNNRIAYFQGERYAFIGLMNAPTLDGEVWSGINEAGFCIMNTASYNLRQDTLQCQMDREGELMYHALGHCATLDDFEAWLMTYPQPWGVEANFGIIDAKGGAAYYEINNTHYVKYDVNDEENGYRVVTNFSFAGRYEDYEGYERYLTASAIMKEAFSPQQELSASDVLNLFSRQYRHELLGIHLNADNVPLYTVDQDFIPRRITSAMVVFQGVKPGDNPLHTIMWTALGYPACAVAVPLLMHPEHLPHYMLARSMDDLHCEMCDASLSIKDQWAFPLHISNGKRYIATQTILRGTEDKPALLTCSQEVEQTISSEFLTLYQQWVKGAITDKVFWGHYDQLAEGWMQKFHQTFAPYQSKAK